MDVQVFRKGRFNGLKVIMPELPRRGSREAAGYDVFAFLPGMKELLIAPLETVLVPTGLYMAEESQSVILACSRSGLASKGVFLPNAPGIIDSDYRGEIKIPLIYIAPPNSPAFVIKDGDRVGQLLFLSPGKINMDVQFREVDHVDSLRQTDRGDGGFGSTGK